MLPTRFILLLIWGKCTFGVLAVGPYSPRFLAATDLRGVLMQGKGEKICCGFGGSPAKVEGLLPLSELEESEA